MSGVLIIGTTTPGGSLQPASLEIASAGRALAQALQVPLLGGLMGSACEQATEEFAAAGMSRLFVVDDPRLRQYLAQPYVTAALTIAQQCTPTVILAAHTLDTAEWAPQLAASLTAAVLTECHAIGIGPEGSVVMTKPVCGGAIQADYVLKRNTLVTTLAPGMYVAQAQPRCSSVTALALPETAGSVSVLEELHDQAGSGPSLKEARTVIAGGLGIGGRDHWNLVTDTAATLGAAVGATRAVVEAGWVPSSQQVGYSGTRVAPDLYMAIGISGAVHHLVGISQAKTVVAINTDPNADIFRVARFGVVGDAKTIIPAFIARARALRDTSVR